MNARVARLASFDAPLEHARHLRRVASLVGVAALSVWIVPYTPLRVLGPLTTALLVGIALGVTPFVRWIPRPSLMWLSREVLRAAVVLTAVRLDWIVLARAGAGPIVIAATAVVVGLLTFAVLLRALRVPPRLGALLAIGTSVCGAAAIAAARSVVDSTDDEAHVGIAIVSVLGAAASLALVVAHGFGLMPGALYGLVAGGSLHEVAHVMAAATADPRVLDVATVTKLARVALLPVALLALPFVAPSGTNGKRAPFRVPGLVIGFFSVSVVATVAGYATSGSPLAGAWKETARLLALVATIMLASSMVAIGALVDWKMLRRAGPRTLAVAIAGALILAGGVIGVAARAFR